MAPKPSSSDEEIEPYYVAKITRDSPGPVATTQPPPDLGPLGIISCPLGAVIPTLCAGGMGYIFGAGMTSLSMITNKSQRGLKQLHLGSKTNAKTFALVTLTFSVPVCILNQLRGINIFVAGACSGAAIAWGKGPTGMLISALGMGVLSAWLNRGDPAPGPAHAISREPRTYRSQITYSSASSSDSLLRRPYSSALQEDSDLLAQTALCLQSEKLSRKRNLNTGLSVSSVWGAVKPGCACCKKGPTHSQFL